MGYYKVPQDVEAEDKLLGPFTFKQFIFLLVTVIAGFVAFQLMVTVSFFVALPLLPFIFVTALIALYHPKDQPVENKVLAYVNFFFKPHKRVWSRDGIVEHVYIKAPKKVEKNFTDGRSQDQVRSQLKQLAQIVDTRGWSTKRADIQEPTSNFLSDDDRLIQPSQVTVVTDNNDGDISGADDIYDQSANPIAQAFQERTAQSEQQSREQLLARLRANALQAADAQADTPAPAAYVNPYATLDDADVSATTPIAETEEQRRKRIKELESSPDLPISSIAARAQEFTIKHDEEPDVLTIEH